jgi:hypothetical protein
MTGYPYTYPIVWFTGGAGSFLINGLDFSPYVHLETFEIDNILNSRIDTCSFSMDNASTFPHWVLGTGTLGGETIISDDIDILEESEIIILNSLGTRIFAGIVVDIQRTVIAGIQFYECSCQDYTVLTEKRLVNKVYISKTDKEILTDLFTVYLSEISV